MMYSLTSIINPGARSAIRFNGSVCARPLSNILSHDSSVTVSRSNVSSNKVSPRVSSDPLNHNIRTTSMDMTRFLSAEARTIGISGVRTFHCWAGYERTSLQPYRVNYEQVRYGASSFFTKHTAEQLWKSVTSVSPAGRRRGRGKKKDRRMMRDLNRGQVLGIGKENIRWPGLSAPIIRGREIVQKQHLPPDEKYQENLNKMRDTVYKAKKFRLAAIDRGWSGGHAGGRRIGPPDPVAGETFEGFDTVILCQNPVVHQTSHQGRLRSLFVVCCTGNGNGLVGFGVAKAVDAKSAQRRAKNRGANKLMYIPRWENRTLYHNFFSRFGNTKVYAWPQGPGYGLVCHRVIKSICQMIGIKDMYAKVEGGPATLNIMYAFFLGLLRQKTYEELAEETGLHVVELKQNYDYFPNVVATPSCPVESMDEVPDFDSYCFDDKVFLKKKPLPPVFMRYRTWPITLRKWENIRSHYDSNVQLRAEYDGELRSFLTDRYPECRPWLPKWTRSLKNAQKTEDKTDSE